MTPGDVNVAFTEHTRASATLASDLQRYPFESSRIRADIRTLSASDLDAIGALTNLTPDNRDQERYQVALVDASRAEIGANRAVLAGKLTGAAWVRRLKAISDETSQKIAGLDADNVRGVPSSSSSSAGSSGGSGLPYPVNQWWFWVFVAPEAACLVLGALWIIVLGPLLGASTLLERRRRRKAAAS